jgi:hypothetical protein
MSWAGTLALFALSLASRSGGFHDDAKRYRCKRCGKTWAVYPNYNPRVAAVVLIIVAVILVVVVVALAWVASR